MPHAIPRPPGAATGSFDQFVRTLRRSRLLTAPEERRLAALAARGDRNARDALIVANLRLVVATARRFQGLGVPLQDLVQEGAIGLARAVELFDPARGTRFATYAGWWIRQALQRAVEHEGRTIRTPRRSLQAERRLARVERELTARLGRFPTQAELAGALGLTPAALAELRARGAPLASLDAPAGEEEHVDLHELLPANDADTSGRTPLRQAVVARAVADLPQRERAVIELRFGLGPAAAPSTLDAVGSRLGVTSERARQIEAQALGRLARRRELAEVA
jgi:RNA polymerase primary sigma factor